MPLSKYYGGSGLSFKKKKHEKSESKKEEKLESGPSSKMCRKHGV